MSAAAPGRPKQGTTPSGAGNHTQWVTVGVCCYDRRHAHHHGVVLCTHCVGRRFHWPGVHSGIQASNAHMLISVKEMFNAINKFPLAAIPFFILAGNIMETGGISRRLSSLPRALWAVCKAACR